jgi:alkanesulfonate monooxygenase SsuD/methylene tetrahydromethanopterin reductase-like flavin-dependent oxidoreductase (luciferase family)
MTRARAFRFGVFGENARSRGALLETARRAEDSGNSTFLLRDHFIEEPFGHQLATLTALATVAGATKELRVGSLVLSNDYRHPVMLAKEIATLDVLSNGRISRVRPRRDPGRARARDGRDSRLHRLLNAPRANRRP